MASAVADYHASGNARFNAEALSWDSRPFVHEASLAASKAILARIDSLPQKSKSDGVQTLEIGCGTGILSFLLAKSDKVHKIVAVDAAEGMIDVLKKKLDKDERAKQKILPFALLLEDPEDSALPAADDGKQRQKFDVITSHLVLHHIPDLKAVLKTMYGCLKPGGCLMLTDFEDFGPTAKRFHPASKMAGVARHGINAKAMEQLLTEVGFEEVGVKAEWTMDKTVEKFDGEFDKVVKPEPGTGEVMQFPFVLCYGVRR